MMPEIEQCSFDTVTERSLFMLELNTAHELPSHTDVRSKYFGIFLAWDARNATHRDIASFITPLIEAGSVYFVCWGPDCERVHDIANECDPYKNTDSVIMTTWHTNRSLDNAVWDFLNTMFPDPAFENDFHSSLAVSIGSESWASVMRAALHHPRAFTSRVLANERDV